MRDLLERRTQSHDSTNRFFLSEFEFAFNETIIPSISERNIVMLVVGCIDLNLVFTEVTRPCK